MSKVDEFLKRVNQEMVMLQKMMDANVHLVDKETVQEQCSRCSLYYTFLDDGDRDYLQVARDAVEEGTHWDTSE
jgi:hypothetical protein